MRVTAGPVTRRRHKKILQQAKGYRWGRKNLYRRAKQAVLRAGVHEYIGRKQKKRTFRRLWITRLSGAVRAEGMKYSEFMNGITRKRVEVDRKMLSNLAIEEPTVFKEVLELVKG
jgi:large subunit ribosomal protein L20